MENLLLFLTVAAAGAWAGAILFHSSIVAPATFRVLDSDSAGLFLRTLFPRFFRFGLVCGALMLVGLIGAAVISGNLAGVPTVLATAMMVSQSICLVMVPAINTARDLGEAGRQRFARLHLLSVLLTLSVLAMSLVVIYLLTD